MVLKRSVEEIEDMRERKKQKNRESAQRARDRFKAKMRWLEDQVRGISERHDNLLRENTYMRGLLNDQTVKLNQLLARENAEMEKERSSNRKNTSSASSDKSSDDDSGNQSPKSSSFSINFLAQSSKQKEIKTEPKSPPSQNASAQSLQNSTNAALQNFYNFGMKNQADAKNFIENMKNEAAANLNSAADLSRMVYPTAQLGYLPRQVPRPLFAPSLGNLPSLRLSPGGTMTMEHQSQSPNIRPANIDDLEVDEIDVDDAEVDVGSPLRSDSDPGLGSSELNTSEHTHSSSDMDNLSEH